MSNQTGPAIRKKDFKTIEKHLQFYQKIEKEIY